jgi:hypothetical protein
VILDRDDADLFDRVRKSGLADDARSINAARLSKISAEHGIDFATAVFYLAHRASDDLPGPEETPPTLLIVPGAFHRHHHGTGADGSRLMAAARELGWPAEVLPVGSLASVLTNAEILIDHLTRLTGRPVVLASLSKGSADVVAALRHQRAADAFASVQGWLNLSGLVRGTALIEWLRARPLRLAGVHLLLWSKGLRFAPLDELRRSPGGPVHEPWSLPSHVRAIHVVGCPTRRHLRHPWAVRGYDRLTPLGPNDGGGILLGDLAGLPGLIYPVWGTDHYLDPPWDFSQTVRRLLRHAAQSHSAASATPDTRSTA